MADEKILISVDVDTEKMQKELSLAISKVASLKESQKLLTQGIIEGKDADGQMAKELARVSAELEKNQRQVKAQTALIQAATSEGLKENATLDEQRQYLNTLQKAYAQLSDEQRGSIEDTKSLTYQIKQLSDAVKEQEHNIGDDRRNVGNYTESIQKASGAFGKLKTAMEGVSGGSTAVTKGIDNIGKGMTGLAMNPLMTTIFVLVTIGGSILNLLKKNEEEMEEVNMAMAGIGAGFDKILKPALKWLEKFLLENLKKAIDWTLEALKTFLGWIDKVAKFVGKDLGLVAAFEAGAAAAREETEVVEEETSKQVDLRKKAAEELAKVRDEIAKRERTELENKLHDLETAMERELAIVGLTEEEKQKIRDYYRAEEDKARSESEAKAKEEIEKAAKDAEAKELAKQEARKKALESFGLVDGETPEQAELRLLQEARDKDLINAEEYEIAKTLIGQKYSDKRSEQIEKEITHAAALYEQSVKTTVSASSAALKALGDLCGEYAEQSEGAANAQKAFAFGAILINEAMSIAEGAKGIAAAAAGAAEAAAATGPAAPFMLPIYTASMVGEVLAMVTSVASTIVESKQIFSKADKHADGVLLPGNYDGRDDIPAWLSRGEMVLNPNQASKVLWNMANTNMTGYNYESMAAAMAAAVAQMPAPELALTELASAQGRVTTYNEIASL